MAWLDSIRPTAKRDAQVHPRSGFCFSLGSMREPQSRPTPDQVHSKGGRT